MITKERLTELIEQGAIIYRTYADVNVYDVKLNKKVHSVDNACLWEKQNNGTIKKCGYSYCQLFETKEEAEWYLKFGNIARTETLSLPTFEEIIKEVGMNGTYNIEFTSKNEWDECTLSVCTSRQYIVVEGYKHWDLTKANYIEACELAKKLFLGEEV